MITSSFSPFRRLAALIPVLLLTGTALAAAQTVTISSVPYTITASGKYVLGGNLTNTSTSTPAITVSAPNVNLDLNGFYISGAGNSASGNYVISVGDVANVFIRNGLVSNEGYGIRFAGGNNSRNYIVENMTISRCYRYGIYVSTAAPGTLLRNNAFSNLGNSTAGSNTFPRAIYTNGGVRIDGNLIANVNATGTGTSYGIDANAGDFSIGNTISNCTTGILRGKYLNNLTVNVTTPFSSGTNAVGNN